MSESAGFVTIKDLAGATLATEDDDLIIQQGEETKRINLKTLGDLLVFLDKIEQVKTSTENGGINEIKATLSDGSTATFTTQNGHGIQKIEQTVKSDVSSGTNVITATLSDGQKSNFEVKNGDQGEKGDTGASLIDVVQKETSAVSGGKNVISFKLNDGSYKDVEVYNGAKGETGEVSQEVLNQTVNEAIAGVVANAPSDFDTLKEMSDWISEHEDDATAMNTAILENKNSIDQRRSVRVGEIYFSGSYYKVATTGYYARPIEFEVKTSKGSYNKFVFGQAVTSKHFKFGNTANSSFRYIAPESNETEGALLIKSSNKDIVLDIFNTSNFLMEKCTLSETTVEEWNRGADFPQSFSVEELKKIVQEQLNGIQITNTGKETFDYYAISYSNSLNAYSNQQLLMQFQRTDFAPLTFIFSATSSTYQKRVSVTKLSNNEYLEINSIYRVSFYIDTTNKTLYVALPSYSKMSFKDLLCSSNLVSYTKVDSIPDTAMLMTVGEYATKNNVQNYSTTPQKIGTWIDGKDVYRVVIENELKGNILGQLAGTVESGAKIISAKGQITDVMDDTYIVPYFSSRSSIGLSIEGNSIYFTGYSDTSFTNVKLVVEYTK